MPRTGQGRITHNNRKVHTNRETKNKELSNIQTILNKLYFIVSVLLIYRIYGILYLYIYMLQNLPKDVFFITRIHEEFQNSVGLLNLIKLNEKDPAHFF